jgi:hypothetical protein
MKFEVLNCTDASKWNAFVGISPQGSVFCTTNFINALGVESEFLTLQCGGVICAGAVLLRCHGELVPAPHLFTMYQGVLLAPSLCEGPIHRVTVRQHEAIQTILQDLAIRQIAPSFCLHYELTDVRPFLWAGYDQQSGKGLYDHSARYTSVIRTNTFGSFEAYFDTIRDVRRQEYRKSARLGVTVIESDDVDLLNHLYGLTFQRQGRTCTDYEQYLLKEIVKQSLAAKWGRLVFAMTPEGRAASAAHFIFDKNCGYYLFGANDPDYAKMGAGTAVMLDQIKYCFRTGRSNVDFVGVNSPNRADFKISFNSVPKLYFVITSAHNRV